MGSRQFFTMSLWRELTHKILPFHSSEWKPTNQAIDGLLSEPNPDVQKALTIKWYQNMVPHLQVILITVRLILAILRYSSFVLG